MEARKVEVNCSNCHELLTVDFATDNFSSEILIFNGKKQQRRTYLKECPHCETINYVMSDKKEEWGKRKGPNIKLFLFSGMFSCLGIVVLGFLFLYFAFQGFGVVFDWLFN